MDPEASYSRSRTGNIQENAEARPQRRRILDRTGRLIARSRHRTLDAALREWLEEFTAPSGGAAGGRPGPHAGANAGSAAADLLFPTAFSMAANSSAERMGFGR